MTANLPTNSAARAADSENRFRTLIAEKGYELPPGPIPLEALKSTEAMTRWIKTLPRSKTRTGASVTATTRSPAGDNQIASTPTSIADQSATSVALVQHQSDSVPAGRDTHLVAAPPSPAPEHAILDFNSKSEATLTQEQEQTFYLFNVFSESANVLSQQVVQWQAEFDRSCRAAAWAEPDVLTESYVQTRHKVPSGESAEASATVIRHEAPSDGSGRSHQEDLWSQRFPSREISASTYTAPHSVPTPSSASPGATSLPNIASSATLSASIDPQTATSTSMELAPDSSIVSLPKPLVSAASASAARALEISSPSARPLAAPLVRTQAAEDQQAVTQREPSMRPSSKNSTAGSGTWQLPPVTSSASSSSQPSSASDRETGALGVAGLIGAASQSPPIIPQVPSIAPSDAIGAARGMSTRVISPFDDSLDREKREYSERLRDGRSPQKIDFFERRFIPTIPLPARRPLASPMPEGTSHLDAYLTEIPITGDDEDVFDTYNEKISSYVAFVSDAPDVEMAESEPVEVFTANAKYGWRTDRILTSDTVPEEERHGLIILNQKINNRGLLARLLHGAGRGLVICADGGANRLYDAFKGEGNELQRSLKPSVIKGDLDSLRPEVRAYYEQREVKVIKDPDQNSGDLEKAMSEFFARTENETHRPLVIFGGQSGRRDQTANVESNVEKRRKRNVDGRLVGRDIRIISDNNICWPLAAGGTHKIHIDPEIYGGTCSILPISGPSYITTEGLQWDVQDWRTKMGEQVSTSNAIPTENLEGRKEVRIHTTHTVWWQMQLNDSLLDEPAG